MGQHFYHQRFQRASKHGALNLEPLIKIEKEKITRNRELFHGIRFNLDKDSLRKIQQAQQTGRGVYLSPSLLADLRYYALTDGENCLQSGLTFCTYYLRGGSEEALMRSVIAMDGDILHQIKGDCLERPNFCRQISSAHYWLIQQLMNQLRFGVLVRLTLLSWGLSILIVAALIIPLLPSLMRLNPWLLLATLVMFWLLQIILQRLISLCLPMSHRWAWRQFLSALLSDKPLKKQIVKGILRS